MSEENKITHLDREIKFILGSPLGRVFLWRLIYEICHTFDSEFQTNASAYVLLGKQQIGKRLLNALRAVNMEKTQLAEREYFELLEHEKQQKENENGNPLDSHGLPCG